MGGFYFQNVMDVFTDEKVITQIIMKKIFIALAALATLAACNKEAAIETPQGDAIAFGDAFVDNTTKAIYTAADQIQGFSVWGNVKGINDTPLALYPGTGAEVTRDGAALGAAWTCNVARYWTPSATYNFTAIANGTAKTVVNGIPTHISYTINPADAADLVYGTTTASTNNLSVPTSGVNDAKVVTFTLRHLLSRLQVSFQNLIPGTEYTYSISEVKVTTWDKGVYEIAAQDTKWTQDGTGTTPLSYNSLASLANNAGAVSAGAQLVIPGSLVELSFKYVLSLNGTEIYQTTISKQITTALLEGNSYTINVKLKAGEKIDFSVSETNGLAGWGNGGSSNVQL